MIRVAADEDFDNDILRGLLRRVAELDVVRVQDADLSGADDITVLEWAAREQRVLLTHDVSTMSAHALERIRRGESLPGVIIVHQRLPIGATIEDLLLIVLCTDPADWQDRVAYLPLR